MNLPKGIELVRYRSLNTMGEDVRKCVRTMGHPERDYHLRRVASGARGFTLHSARVMFKGGRPIGWSAYYNDEVWKGGRFPSTGFWINEAHRGRGYGQLLIRDGYRWWRRFNPDTFGLAKWLWTEWDDARLK